MAAGGQHRFQEVEPVRVVVDHDLLVPVQQLLRVRHGRERTELPARRREPRPPWLYRVAVDADPLLDDLDAEQRVAVLSDGGPLCIVAPAGSGKTRVLTRRIARRLGDGSAEAGHVLVITFTRRAAGELTRRLRGLSPRDAVAAGTFHGIAYRLLRQRWDDQRRRPPELLTNRLRLVEEAMTDTPRGRPRRGERTGRGGAAEIAGEIDWARARRHRSVLLRGRPRPPAGGRRLRRSRWPSTTPPTRR